MFHEKIDAKRVIWANIQHNQINRVKFVFQQHLEHTWAFQNFSTSYMLTGRLKSSCQTIILVFSFFTSSSRFSGSISSSFFSFSRSPNKQGLRLDRQKHKEHSSPTSPWWIDRVKVSAPRRPWLVAFTLSASIVALHFSRRKKSNWLRSTTLPLRLLCS